uniref:Uncharacterized protein n=1 Tax=Siphoviridae sp. ctOow3 TaxID=2826315 RepID=A0A8S5QZX8_9CAUD|nr:MAG TPA: hypothetical protein [Siphoviridae sp. ctOow3]
MFLYFSQIDKNNFIIHFSSSYLSIRRKSKKVTSGRV